MPLYELFVISRGSINVLDNATTGLHGVMKRTASKLMERNALLSKIEYLGERDLPYRMKLKEAYIYNGKYNSLFLLHCLAIG